MDTKLIRKLEIELPFVATDIIKLMRLGIDGNQIRKVAQRGLFLDNAIHWCALAYSMALGEIDTMLDDPTVYIMGMQGDRK